MRIADFLIYLLEAHAQTLHRLAALFGDDLLLHMLEQVGEKMENEPAPEYRFQVDWFQKVSVPGYSSPYLEIESAVRDFKLPSVLEFHLWTYPLYRAYVESSLSLDDLIPGPGADVGSWMVDESVQDAQHWMKRLPITSEFSKQAESAAHAPWLKFRTQVLKRIGKRPLGPVY